MDDFYVIIDGFVLKIAQKRLNSEALSKQPLDITFQTFCSILGK